MIYNREEEKTLKRTQKRTKKALAVGQSPLQELKEGLHRGRYLSVSVNIFLGYGPWGKGTGTGTKGSNSSAQLNSEK